MSRPSLLVLLSLAACGFPRPALLDDAGPDASGDAELPPGVSIRVATTGDDANDGLAAPVKTLKHAIGLAAANPEITSIVLASGRYSTTAGETFPYTLPANLTLLGPAGGGAILTGSKSEPGIVINEGTLRDLELEDFTVAITATGTAHLSGLRIRTGTTAMRATGAAVVTVDNVDIAGTAGACASGIELSGTSTLTANLLATRALQTSLTANDQAQATLSHASFSSSHCDYNASVVNLTASPKPFVIEDSTIDGGDNGISNNFDAPAVNVSIRNTTIQNLTKTGVEVFKGTLDVVDSSFSKQQAALLIGNMNTSLTNVSFQQHGGAAIQLGTGQLKMRRCTFTDNHESLYIASVIPYDLGTTQQPGGNTFQNGFNSLAIEVESGVAVHISAVGNTWRASVQNADNAGHYPSTTLNGPVGFEAGQFNFKLPAGATVDL